MGAKFPGRVSSDCHTTNSIGWFKFPNGLTNLPHLVTLPRNETTDALLANMAFSFATTVS